MYCLQYNNLFVPASPPPCLSSSLPPGGAIKKPLRDLVVADSQMAVLECEVANPTAEGKWLKDGNNVDFNENTSSEAKGAVRRLVIAITKSTDVGEYTYQVATSKTTATLRVEGTSLRLSASSPLRSGLIFLTLVLVVKL